VSVNGGTQADKKKKAGDNDEWCCHLPHRCIYLLANQKNPTLLDQARTGLVAMVPSYRRPHHQVELRS